MYSISEDRSREGSISIPTVDSVIITSFGFLRVEKNLTAYFDSIPNDSKRVLFEERSGGIREKKRLDRISRYIANS